MLPTTALFRKFADLVAAEVATLAPATGNKVALIKAEFTPAKTLVMADLTLADFDGSTPIVCGTGTQPTGDDPGSGDRKIDILPPAGGWRWETTGTTNLPQTIHGFCLMDNAGTTLLGTELLDEPIVLSAADQVLELPDVAYHLLESGVS